KRRFPNGTDDPADSIASQTTRGFTGQENLDAVGLVHLNGRVYDPLIGRMMSADPYVPDPTNAQTWNRYSYVINNPLSITDPNGYCFLGLCSAFSHVFHELQHLLRSVPIIGSIIQIAATAVCFAAIPACQLFLRLVAAGAAAFVAGVTSGNLGAALRAGVIAGVTALANAQIGVSLGNPGFDSPGYFANVVAHAVVGCASAAASG